MYEMPREASITADFNNLFEQAKETASSFFHSAVRTIDAKFGAGYSAKHPELVAAFMRVSGNDFNISVALKLIEPVIGELADSIDRVGAGVEERTLK
jgi:hypothetical protein